MSNCWPFTSPGFLTGSVSPVFSLKVYMRSISYLRHSRFVSNSLPSEAVYLPMVGLVFRWVAVAAAACCWRAGGCGMRRRLAYRSCIVRGGGAWLPSFRLAGIRNAPRPARLRGRSRGRTGAAPGRLLRRRDGWEAFPSTSLVALGRRAQRGAPRAASRRGAQEGKGQLERIAHAVAQPPPRSNAARSINREPGHWEQAP